MWTIAKGLKNIPFKYIWLYDMYIVMYTCIIHIIYQNHLLDNTITRSISWYHNKKHSQRKIIRHIHTDPEYWKYQQNLFFVILLVLTNSAPPPQKKEKRRKKIKKKILFPRGGLEHHKIFKIVPCAMPDISWTFQENPYKCFFHYVAMINTDAPYGLLWYTIVWFGVDWSCLVWYGLAWLGMTWYLDSRYIICWTSIAA